MKHVRSLTAQLAAVRQAIRMLANNKPAAMRESERDLLVSDLQAVEATLAWLTANEPVIKQRLAQ